MFKIYTLGDFDIVINDKSILKSIENQHRLMKLLKYFITFNGRKVLPYRIMDELWIGEEIKDPLSVAHPVVWNKVNTFEWYKDRVYKLSDNYDNTDYYAAYEKSREFGDKIPIGVLYKVEKPTYDDSFEFLKNGKPLVNRNLDPFDAKKLMNDFV